MEDTLLKALRAIANDPAARGLADDAAVIGDLVLTHDMLVEGVHFLANDPPADVAWKLLAVNLSDLAAKGAQPFAALLGLGMRRDLDWGHAFVAGLGEACTAFGLPLIGGDTVAMPDGAPHALGLTAIGKISGPVPSRAGAAVGDALYVAGTIGDAGLGLRMARGDIATDARLLAAYRRPVPMMETGRALAPHVTAMMDISDGLLLDATRLAAASGVGVRIRLDTIPISLEYQTIGGDDRDARLVAATAGDDYALLFTATKPLPAVPGKVARIGEMIRGSGLSLVDAKGVVDLPARLGWIHD